MLGLPAHNWHSTARRAAGTALPAGGGHQRCGGAEQTSLWASRGWGASNKPGGGGEGSGERRLIKEATNLRPGEGGEKPSPGSLALVFIASFLSRAPVAGSSGAPARQLLSPAKGRAGEASQRLP